MNDLKTKWESLESSRSDTYLFEPLDAFNLFIGLTPNGKRILALDIKDKDEINLDHFPKWRGAPVEHKKINSCYYMLITLLDETFANILNDLINNLIIRFSEIKNINESLDTLSAWLIEYQSFFTQTKKPLSETSQRGLIGELLFLRDYVLPHKSSVETLHSWRGHDRKYHDFSFDHGNVEVKTTISKEPKKVTISNEKQLDDAGLENLYLSVFILKEAANGRSLPEYIDEIRQIFMQDTTSANLFELYLTHAKYQESDRENYIAYKISEEKMILYRVHDGFPRIIHPENGIGDIIYSITLSACHEYLVEPSELIEL